MKVNNIKTKDEFYRFADIWYQRTKRLSEIAFNERYTISHREKAFRLWAMMIGRLQIIKQKAMELSMPKPCEFPKGGI